MVVRSTPPSPPRAGLDVLRRAPRLLVLVVALAAIALWQVGFTAKGAVIDQGSKVTAATGINREQQFFFFLYHLGLFPLATDAPIKADTKDEARRLLHEQPEQLKQDEGSTFRSGDRGRTYLYFVDAWVRHDAIRPSLVPAHCLAFIVALSALFTAFWWVRRSWHGALLVLLLGSNPFQQFAIYGQENVFSWTITTMVAALALVVPLLWPLTETRTRWYPWVAAAGSGLLVALVRNVRSEPTVVLLGSVLVILTMTWATKRKRAAMIGVLALTFWLGGFVSRQLIDRRFQKTAAKVAEVGGSVFTGPRYYYHEFWHVIWCGLGDFDTKKGYEWNDANAFRYVVPRLQAMHPEEKLRVYHWIERTYDAQGKYPVFIGEISGYHDIVRDKIVGDIKSDPAWYVDILAKRVKRTLDSTTPVGFAHAREGLFVSGRLLGWMWPPLLLVVLFLRRWDYAKLLVFSLPLSITPIAIYSDRGMTNYSTYHVFAVFVVLVAAAEGLRTWRRLRRTRLVPFR